MNFEDEDENEDEKENGDDGEYPISHRADSR